MRISDWSSDVCSSDLGGPARAFLSPLEPASHLPISLYLWIAAPANRLANRRPVGAPPAGRVAGRTMQRVPRAAPSAALGKPVAPGNGARQAARTERKSVVVGKSGPGRGDSGGGRLI